MFEIFALGAFCGVTIARIPSPRNGAPDIIVLNHWDLFSYEVAYKSTDTHAWCWETHAEHELLSGSTMYSDRKHDSNTQAVSAVVWECGLLDCRLVYDSDVWHGYGYR